MSSAHRACSSCTALHAADPSQYAPSRVARTRASERSALRPPLPRRYLNNCICADHCGWSECYLGDAVALAEFEFDGVKLDGCSAAVDLDAYARALGGSGRPIVIENCHWGHTLPTEGWCPFHFYRTSTDILPTYASVVANLHTIVPLANANLSGPGCCVRRARAQRPIGACASSRARARPLAVARRGVPGHARARLPQRVRRLRCCPRTCCCYCCCCR